MGEKAAQLSSLSKFPSGFVYPRHKPEETDLYKIIEQNLPSFQSHLSNAEISLPAFVHDEFRKYLRCAMRIVGTWFSPRKVQWLQIRTPGSFSCKLRGYCRGRRAHPAVLVVWLKHRHT